MKDRVIHLDEVTVTKKKDSLVLDLEKLLNLAVDYTLLLKDDTDSETIKLCLKILIERYKNDYTKIIIDF